jgi:metalloendopeptidase OMA1, mitochondrial
MRTRRLHLFIVFICLIVFGCTTPRRPIPAGEIPRVASVSAADEEYGQQVLDGLAKHYPLDRSDARINRVRDIVDRLTRAAGADHEPWHVYVFRDPQMKNAAATRGNYVFVWSGMIDSVRNDGELGTILAHEIGHVLARHTMPNPSEQVNQIISGVAGRAAREMLARQGGGIGAAAGVAELVISQSMQALIVNPEAQRKELEADQIGLFLMADAGYNPDDAIAFWQRAKNDPQFGNSALEFLSTHPSSTRRLQQLERLLPDAQARYKGHHRFLGRGGQRDRYDNLPDRLARDRWTEN